MEQEAKKRELNNVGSMLGTWPARRSLERMALPCHEHAPTAGWRGSRSIPPLQWDAGNISSVT
jgi:hypothetical protein